MGFFSSIGDFFGDVASTATLGLTDLVGLTHSDMPSLGNYLRNPSGDFFTGLRTFVDPTGVVMGGSRQFGELLPESLSSMAPTLGSLVGTYFAPGWGTAAGYQIGEDIKRGKKGKTFEPMAENTIGAGIAGVLAGLGSNLFSGGGGGDLGAGGWAQSPTGDVFGSSGGWAMEPAAGEAASAYGANTSMGDLSGFGNMQVPAATSVPEIVEPEGTGEMFPNIPSNEDGTSQGGRGGMPWGRLAVNAGINYLNAREQAKALQEAQQNALVFPNAPLVNSQASLAQAGLAQKYSDAERQLMEGLAARGMSGGYASSEMAKLRRARLSDSARLANELIQFSNKPIAQLPVTPVQTGKGAAYSTVNDALQTLTALQMLQNYKGAF